MMIKGESSLGACDKRFSNAAFLSPRNLESEKDEELAIFELMSLKAGRVDDSQLGDLELKV